MEYLIYMQIIEKPPCVPLFNKKKSMIIAQSTFALQMHIVFRLLQVVELL